jgi:hypothetical protein
VSDNLSNIIFERPAKDFRLSTNFEVGLNIQLNEYSPFDVISRYMSCVTTQINEFFTCPRYKLKGKPVERLCCMSDYSLKVYDKSIQANIDEPGLLRYEMIYVQLRKIRCVLNLDSQDEITLSMLNSKETWHLLFKNLINMYDSIKKIPLVMEPLPIDVINHIHGYCSKIKADDIKRSMSANTYKKERKAMERVYDKYNLSAINYHQLVKERLIEKYYSLIY